MAPVSQAPRRYFVELNGAMLLFFAALYGAVWAHRHAEFAPALIVALPLLPIVPILLVALSIFRFFQRVDEFHKRRLLEMMAIGSGVTGVFAVCWIFVEAVGAPHLSILWAWPVMGASWLVTAAIRGWHDKATEGNLREALRNWGVTIALMAVAAGAYVLAAPHLGWPTNWGADALVATGVIIIRAGFKLFSKKSTAC